MRCARRTRAWVLTLASFGKVGPLSLLKYTINPARNPARGDETRGISAKDDPKCRIPSARLSESSGFDMLTGRSVIRSKGSLWHADPAGTPAGIWRSRRVRPVLVAAPFGRAAGRAAAARDVSVLPGVHRRSRQRAGILPGLRNAPGPVAGGHPADPRQLTPAVSGAVRRPAVQETRERCRKGEETGGGVHAQIFHGGRSQPARADASHRTCGTEAPQTRDGAKSGPPPGALVGRGRRRF